MLQWCSLGEDYLFICVFLLFQGVKKLSYRRTAEKNELESVVEFYIGVFQEYVLQISWKPIFYLLLELVIALSILKESRLKILSKLILNLSTNLKSIHIGSIYYQLRPEIVLTITSRYDNLYDIIHNIPICNKTKSKNSNLIYGLNRVIWCNISITDRGDSIDAPVNAIEVSNIPAVRHDRRIGC